MPMNKVPQVAVVGAGYWGRNLVRVFHSLGALRWVCDVRKQTVVEMATKFNVSGTTALEDVLADPACSAVVIATPAAQHYHVAKLCLRSGKDVYVEKPLALKATEGQELVDLANKLGRVLMVGHILEYHPAILELKRLIDTGELGRIYYISSSRLNLGKLRTEENILWSFAPHDLSAIIYLLNEMPRRVSTMGGCYLNARHPDTTMSTCDFESGTQAHIFVSWLHPFKEQKLAVVGSRKMAVFDDMERERKLVLYSHEVNWVDRTPVAKKDEGQIVALPAREPLAEECEHFLECISTRQIPRTGGDTGVRVLRVLEACEKSLIAMGAPVELAPAPSYSAHATAVIDEGAEIGEGTKIWHFSHIMENSRLGKNCNIGQNVVISPRVRIGDNVKIQNNVSVYTGVELEDDVFCGPSMVFTNVVNPRSHVIRREEYRRTLVRRGASIGANATIVCGVTLGEYSFIGAGAVVTHNVPAYALMAGVPAEQMGWMCYCGVKLPNSPNPTCSSCGRNYLINGLVCTELTLNDSGDIEAQQKIVA
jgi:UDP-2-acetamido-3-amino-2,3-dideoxy-glucuronate N-acetyltransferase